MLVISFVSFATGSGEAYFALRSIKKSLGQVIDSLTDSSNQVTSAAQQIASSSEELSSQAESLRSTVGVLFQEVNGVKKVAELKLTPKKRLPIKNNVINFEMPKEMPRTKSQMVVGLEGTIPEENDPRFEEV